MATKRGSAKALTPPQGLKPAARKLALEGVSAARAKAIAASEALSVGGVCGFVVAAWRLWKLHAS